MVKVHCLPPPASTQDLSVLRSFRLAGSTRMAQSRLLPGVGSVWTTRAQLRCIHQPPNGTRRRMMNEVLAPGARVIGGREQLTTGGSTGVGRAPQFHGADTACSMAPPGSVVPKLASRTISGPL